MRGFLWPVWYKVKITGCHPELEMGLKCKSLNSSPFGIYKEQHRGKGMASGLGAGAVCLSLSVRAPHMTWEPPPRTSLHHSSPTPMPTLNPDLLNSYCWANIKPLLKRVGKHSFPKSLLLFQGLNKKLLSGLFRWATRHKESSSLVVWRPTELLLFEFAAPLWGQG